MPALFELRKTCRGGPVYDAAWHMIVRADDEPEARKFAQLAGLDECFYSSTGRFCDRIPMAFWTDPTKTSCKSLSVDGEKGVILVQTLDG